MTTLINETSYFNKYKHTWSDNPTNEWQDVHTGPNSLMTTLYPGALIHEFTTLWKKQYYDYRQGFDAYYLHHLGPLYYPYLQGRGLPKPYYETTNAEITSWVDSMDGDHWYNNLHRTATWPSLRAGDLVRQEHSGAIGQVTKNSPYRWNEIGTQIPSSTYKIFRTSEYYCSGKTGSQLYKTDSFNRDEIVNRDDQYTLIMYDSYGDGWNGATLEIFINGVSTVLVNDLDHWESNGTAWEKKVVKFNVPIGAEIEVIATESTQPAFYQECSYKILDMIGEIIYEGPTNLNRFLNTTTNFHPSMNMPKTILTTEMKTEIKFNEKGEWLAEDNVWVDSKLATYSQFWPQRVLYEQIQNGDRCICIRGGERFHYANVFYRDIWYKDGTNKHEIIYFEMLPGVEQSAWGNLGLSEDDDKDATYIEITIRDGVSFDINGDDISQHFKQKTHLLPYNSGNLRITQSPERSIDLRQMNDISFSTISQETFDANPNASDYTFLIQNVPIIAGNTRGGNTLPNYDYELPQYYTEGSNVGFNWHYYDISGGTAYDASGIAYDVSGGQTIDPYWRQRMAADMDLSGVDLSGGITYPTRRNRPNPLQPYGFYKRTIDLRMRNHNRLRASNNYTPPCITNDPDIFFDPSKNRRETNGLKGALVNVWQRPSGVHVLNYGHSEQLTNISSYHPQFGTMNGANSTMDLSAVIHDVRQSQLTGYRHDGKNNLWNTNPQRATIYSLDLLALLNMTYDRDKWTHRLAPNPNKRVQYWHVTKSPITTSLNNMLIADGNFRDNTSTPILVISDIGKGWVDYEGTMMSRERYFRLCEVLGDPPDHYALAMDDLGNNDIFHGDLDREGKAKGFYGKYFLDGAAPWDLSGNMAFPNGETSAGTFLDIPNKVQQLNNPIQHLYNGGYTTFDDPTTGAGCVGFPNANRLKSKFSKWNGGNNRKQFRLAFKTTGERTLPMIEDGKLTNDSTPGSYLFFPHWKNSNPIDQQGQYHSVKTNFTNVGYAPLDAMRMVHP